MSIQYHDTIQIHGTIGIFTFRWGQGTSTVYTPPLKCFDMANIVVMKLSYIYCLRPITLQQTRDIKRLIKP